MFGFRSHSSASEVTRRIEALKADIAHLGEALEDLAQETARTSQREARRFAHDAANAVAHRAEDVGTQAGALVSSGLAAMRQRRKELDDAAARTQDVVLRHPETALAVAVGVGLITAVVLSLAARKRR